MIESEHLTLKGESLIGVLLTLTRVYNKALLSRRAVSDS
jgi:hypothetical protein